MHGRLVRPHHVRVQDFYNARALGQRLGQVLPSMTRLLVAALVERCRMRLEDFERIELRLAVAYKYLRPNAGALATSHAGQSLLTMRAIALFVLVQGV